MSHRGHHPEDPDNFGPEALPKLRAAVWDLSWLRTRGYGDDGALKLVGDRYRLTRRQRDAVARSACTDAQRDARLRRRVDAETGGLDGRTVHVDGFNVLITVEGLLGGAYLFRGRDTAVRDVNPLQGTYRVVEETGPAIDLLGRAMDAAGASGVVWHLDDPVSNVGRVVTRLWETAEAEGWPWMVEVKADVDAALTDAGTSGGVVATSDADVLDAVDAWTSLSTAALAVTDRDAHLCDLQPSEADRAPDDDGG